MASNNNRTLLDDDLSKTKLLELEIEREEGMKTLEVMKELRDRDRRDFAS